MKMVSVYPSFGGSSVLCNAQFSWRAQQAIAQLCEVHERDGAWYDNACNGA